MTVYRWRGVNPRGKQQFGAADWADLPAEVEAMYGRGWRSLTVYAGDGPVPPPAISPAGLVAAICPHPQTGQRTWWADAGPRARCGARVSGGIAGRDECKHCLHWDDFGPCCLCGTVRPEYLRAAGEIGRALARMDKQRDEEWRRARFWQALNERGRPE